MEEVTSQSDKAVM